MTAKTNFENCGDCSGLKTRVNGVLGILTVLCALLVGTLSQGSNIRAEVAKEVARIDKENALRDVKAQGSQDRIAKLEDVVFKK